MFCSDGGFGIFVCSGCELEGICDGGDARRVDCQELIIEFGLGGGRERVKKGEDVFLRLFFVFLTERGDLFGRGGDNTRVLILRGRSKMEFFESGGHCRSHRVHDLMCKWPFRKGRSGFEVMRKGCRVFWVYLVQAVSLSTIPKSTTANDACA